MISRKSFLFLNTLFLTGLCSYGQYRSSYEDIIVAYDTYIELPRELVYIHSNKTSFISGEQIGIKAYVLEKESKRLSKETSNLYVTLSDDTNTVVKQQLLKVNQGIAVGNFTIDSVLPSGNYVLRSYTNWMKNFKEQNSYVGSIKIINPKDEHENSSLKETKTSLDAQFLPEGGHLVEDVENSIGVAIKDGSGFGIPQLEGEIRDQDNTLTTSFKVNRFGLAKFKLTPRPDFNYTAIIFFNGIDFKFPIQKSDAIGFAMKTQNQENGLKLQLSTNEMSFQLMKNQQHVLAIHNGTALKVIALPDWEDKELVQVIPQRLLYPGVNILTVFDSKNKPITERLYFNDKGLSFINSTSLDLAKDQDSLNINLKHYEVDSLSTMSISVLPTASISYKPNHSISSYTLLSPHVKGLIEEGGYYFQNRNDSKIQDLDLLLLTQGWSSYDWETIFNDSPKAVHDFEEGINAKINTDEEKDRDFLLYPFEGIAAAPINLREGQTTFQVGGLFPFEGDSLKIATLKGKKGNVRPASNLEITFNPTQIPQIDNESKFLFQKEQTVLELNDLEPSLILGDNVQQLNEVVVTEKIKDIELEKLQALSHGYVKAIDDGIRRAFVGNVAMYLASKGYRLVGTYPQYGVVHPVFGPPFIYLDGSIISQPGTTTGSVTQGEMDMLWTINLDHVAYIDINKMGTGEGLRSLGGVIKMYSRTDYSSYRNKARTPVYAEYNFPLKFTDERKFYMPKYASYSSEFYEHYGILGWFPNLRPDVEGSVHFKIPDIGQSEIQLLVEGITKEGKFISEKINVSVNK